MLNIKQKQFLTILVLIALIGSNLLLFSFWNEAKLNIEIVKANAINELVECGCEGYWRGVPYVYHQRDLDKVDLNLLRGKS